MALSPDIISAGTGALTGIASTIAGIVDQAKRRRFEENLALLSNQQQKELNEKLLQVNSQNDRLKILSDSLVNYTIASQNSQNNSNTIMIIVAAVMGITLIVGAFILYAKRSSNA